MEINSKYNYSMQLHYCGYTEQLPPGNVYGPSLSNAYLIQYCTRGRGQFVVNSNVYSLQKGDCFILLPGQTRTEIADPHDPWGLAWIAVSGESANRLALTLGLTDEKQLLSFSDYVGAQKTMLEIVALSTDTIPTKDFQIAAKLFTLFNQFLEFYAPGQKTQCAQYVQRAKHIIETRYMQHSFNISELADKINLNRSYLYVIFKESVGLSPQEYLTQIRIQKACELLKLPNATISIVAYSVGYEPSVFSKAFKKLIGVTPKVYCRSRTL